MTGNSNQSTVLDEMHAERLTMAQEHQAAWKQQSDMNQQLMAIFVQFQQLMSGIMSGQSPPQSFQQGAMQF